MTRKPRLLRAARWALYGLSALGGMAAAAITGISTFMASTGADGAVAATFMTIGIMSGFAWCGGLGMICERLRAWENNLRVTVTFVDQHGRVSN